MGIIVKYAENEIDKQTCLKIRNEVFVKEQGIPKKLEFDDDKVKALNLYALIKHTHVGTARTRRTKNGIKLERFAVLKNYRGRGVGKALVNFILDNTSETDRIYLHAQEPVIGFYLSLGFSKLGAKFMEAGIPHWKMVRK